MLIPFTNASYTYHKIKAILKFNDFIEAALTYMELVSPSGGFLVNIYLSG
jgi:hypothetical protein